MVTAVNAGNIGEIMGELVTASGIVRQEIFDQARVHSEQSGLPVGRVLVMSGHLGEGDLSSALQAAQLVRQGRIGRRQAMLALREAYNQCIPFNEIFEGILDYSPATRLGELLISAEIISPLTAAKIEPQAARAQITLGQLVTRYGIISERVLLYAVELLSFVRKGNLALNAAAETLRATCAASLALDTALRFVVGDLPACSRMKLGRLMAMANLADEKQLLTAAEIGLEEDKPIGQVLLEHGIVERDLLKAALTLQSLVATGSMSETQAADILHRVKSQGVPVEELVDGLQRMKARIVQILRMAGLVNDKDIDRALVEHPGHSHDIVRALIASHIVSMNTVRAGVHCITLIDNDEVNQEAAAAALRHSVGTGIAIDAAVEMLQQQRPNISNIGLRLVGVVHDHLEVGSGAAPGYAFAQ